jgi:ligand-binding sensor domain-containing protein
LFVFDGSVWANYIPAGFSTPSGYVVNALKKSNNQLVLNIDYAIFTFTTSLASYGYYSGYFADITRANDAVLDNTNSIWIADAKYGLVQFSTATGTYSYFYPNGPTSENAINMSLSDDQLWIAPGGYTKYFADGLYKLKEQEWSNVKSTSSAAKMDTILDFMNVLIDPNNAKHVYAATWGQGVLELNNDYPVKLFNTTNSSLSGLGLPGYNPVWTYGLALDENSNLWVSNSGVPNSLAYKLASGVWGAVNFSLFYTNLNVEQLLIDKSDQKWFTIANGGRGIVVYKGNTTANANLTNAKRLTTAVGNGHLPSNTVYCLAKDKNDEIWIGTDKGIAVFYSPENVFSGSNFDAQQILLEQDGHVQILFETENVLSIAVDDANRKWVGTSSSGVFLMSADGTKQIAHFDENNSPLFSNNVKSIAINHKTGEVYFGTSKGVISYRGTATEAFESFTDVYAFPNPVKHEYDGPIAIKGLTNNATLKITDISGTLVYETKSEGGQALWYGKNFKEERVSSGVYLVFCTSEDGAEKIVTKILVIN